MNQEEIRQKLIDGTIRVIARDGLDKASAKQIEVETGLNVAYIYRCFVDKEDMFAKAFDSLDEELLGKAMLHVSVMYVKDMEYETRCWVFFSSIWKFLLGNRDKCLAFIRYYYSPQFEKYSAETHKKRYLPLVEKFSDAFHTEANVWMLLNHILTTMLDFAVKVHSDALPDNNDTAEHVFRLVYFSMQPYFKKNEEAASE